jgi:tetratricopeptide (TPR) repeat protein
VSEKFQVASLSEMEIPVSNPKRPWAPVRAHLGIESFGVNAWRALEAGVDVIGEHDEVGPSSPRHQELYVVVSGRATFTVDGESTDVPAGTCVFVRDPEAKRKAVAQEEGTTVLAIGARPGVPFTPSQWERSAPAFVHFATKEYDKAAAVLSEAHEEYPDDAGILFNLACAESLLGRPDQAIEHLRQSIANDDSFREIARSDSDFDPIREEPAFRELVAG